MPAPIGMLDSGIGGLTIMRAIREQMPGQPVIYVADQAHVPYGVRQVEEVRGFAKEITRFLISQGAKLIVVACNTASLAALRYLRKEFPKTPFVGMEPAVKPAAEQTKTGVVGVLATYAAFHTDVYNSVVERFAQNVKLLQNHCPGLVNQIEKGDLSGLETRRILESALRPMIAQGIDTVVLGCTHYPFVIPLIQEIVGPKIRVIDPAPAIARQTERLLTEHGWLMDGKTSSEIRLITTGNPQTLEKNLPLYLGYHLPVEAILWQDGKLE
jgi:glutamate racemase